jgi:flagellar protein FliS
MNVAQATRAYRQSESFSKIHPVKLIHLLYERVLVHLQLAKEGIEDGSPKKRGENLGKAIAIITELNASVQEKDNPDVAAFLRGLYSAVLTELAQVSLSNDVHVLSRTMMYMSRLKEVWEQTAMKEFDEQSNQAPAVESQARIDVAGRVKQLAAAQRHRVKNISV